MFESQLCMNSAEQCKIMTGYTLPSCRFFARVYTTGEYVYFTVEGGKVEVNWGDDTWVTYEPGVITGKQLVTTVAIPIQIRGIDPITKIFFGNRASPDYNYLAISIDVGLDLVDVSRICYNLHELTEFAIYGSNKIVTFESALERCCSLHTITALDISNAVTVEKLAMDCKNLTSTPGLYSETCLTAEKAFSGCSSMMEYSNIVMPGCTAWKETFAYNLSLPVMNFIDTSSGENFEKMFYNCISLECIHAVDTTNQYNTKNMFGGCVSLVSPNVQQQTLIKLGYDWNQLDACDSTPCDGITCYNFRVLELTEDGVAWVKLVTLNSNYFMVGKDKFGCNPDDNPTTPDLEFGLDCSYNCPDCVTFNSYDSVEGFKSFELVDGSLLSVGVIHGNCSEINYPNPELDYGYTCEIGYDCPDCVNFYTRLEDNTGFESYRTNSSEDFMIGTIRGGCVEVTTPEVPNYGLDCEV